MTTKKIKMLADDLKYEIKSLSNNLKRKEKELKNLQKQCKHSNTRKTGGLGLWYSKCRDCGHTDYHVGE